MQTIHYKDVVIPPERQRKEFSQPALEELRDSILKPFGLLQPIVLRDDEATLVCGERRLRAISMLYDAKAGIFTHNGQTVPYGEVPYVRLSQLDPNALHEAELEENVQREDLTWQERVQAQAALHKHYSSSNPEHTITATAEKIYGDATNKRKVHKVAEAVRLAEYLDDPLVAGAPDEKTARRAIKDELARRERQTRLRDFSASSTPHRLFHADAFATARETDTRFDCIVTDPPYGIDANKAGFSFDGVAHDYDDSDDYFETILAQLPKLCHDLTQPQAHVYCFCDIRRFTELYVAFELGGFTVWPRPLIWDKGAIGSYANIEYGPRACYDAILFANRGQKQVTGGFRDIISIPQETTHAHPAGKPVKLYADLLRRSVLPGDKVADFFAGGGPIFPAAHDLNVVAYGWEISEAYHELALAQLEKLK